MSKRALSRVGSVGSVGFWLMAGGCGLGCADSGDTQATPQVTSMTLVMEKKIIDILPKVAKEYEGSGVQLHGDFLYVVFDNMQLMARINKSLTGGGILGSVTESSNFEGITADTNGTEHLYVMKEMDKSSGNKGKVIQFDTMGVDQGSELSDVVFGGSKGFEGIAWLWVNNDDYLLALCEGNDCTDDEMNKGRGKLHLLKQKNGEWLSESVLSIPSKAHFIDYSDIALYNHQNGTYGVAITSQQSSQLWLGTLNTSPFGFSDEGVVVDFPKGQNGETQYCSVEGVTFDVFAPNPRLYVVSDASDGLGLCPAKDAMVHLFELQ